MIWHIMKKRFQNIIKVDVKSSYRWCSCIFVCSATLLLTACGGGGGGDDTVSTGKVSLGLSDAPVEDLSSVTITIDKITFRRPDNTIVIDTFTIPELDLVDADTFTLDLLEVQGNDNIIAISSLDLLAGDYQNLLLEIIDEDINASYVDEVSSGLRKIIKVPSDELKLGGFTVESGGVQTVMVEFDLRHSMTYNPGPDRYILKPRGVRVVDVSAAATIEGTVESALFSTGIACSEKVDPLAGNVVYLYRGHDIDATKYGDTFDRSVDADVPVDIVEPYSAATVADDGSFIFAYLPAGDYTLAYSCEALDDDPVKYQGLVIASPESERLELTVSPADTLTCNFPLVEGNCG